ncbi:MAG TPA: hypothetical protein VNJ29_01025 [Candidatus Nitrosotenuis sp.]|jgi:hypothetical protein|nr:hypothetical protein [Candidatus Nitrosotenuis sp.]
MLNTLKKLSLCILFLSFSMEVSAQDKDDPIEESAYPYYSTVTVSPSRLAQVDYSPPSYVHDITKDVIAANLHIFYEGQPDEFVVKGRRWRLKSFHKDNPLYTIAELAQDHHTLLIPAHWDSPNNTEGNYGCTYYFKCGGGQWFGRAYTGSYLGEISLTTPITEESKKEENKE